MRTVIAVVVTGMSVMSGPALAQTAGEPPPAASQEEQVLRPLGGMVPAPPMLNLMRDGRGARMLGMRENREGPPPPSGGAEFTLKRGPNEVRVRCSVNEPTKVCADAALALMDKLAGLPGDGAPPPPPGEPPAEEPAVQ